MKIISYKLNAVFKEFPGTGFQLTIPLRCFCFCEAGGTGCQVGQNQPIKDKDFGLKSR